MPELAEHLTRIAQQHNADPSYRPTLTMVTVDPTGQERAPESGSAAPIGDI